VANQIQIKLLTLSKETNVMIAGIVSKKDLAYFNLKTSYLLEKT
jgi:hypothetical protein